MSEGSLKIALCQMKNAEIGLTRSREIRNRRPYTGLRRTEWYK